MSPESPKIDSPATDPNVRAAVRELMADPGSLPLLWGRRGFWQIKLRWAVAPLTVLGVLVGRWLGFELAVMPFLVVAAGTLVYNAAFAWLFSRHERRLSTDRQFDRLLLILQVGADYVAMFVLLHLTGGAGSPLAVFLIFHVIIAAIQFRPKIAYLLAAWAAGTLWLLWWGDVGGWFTSPVILLHGEPPHLLGQPAYTAGSLLFLTAALFLSVSMVHRIMIRLHAGLAEVAGATSELGRANAKLSGLYGMVRTIGAERKVEPILGIVTSELARELNIPAVAVTLLDEDERALRYVATHGLPDSFRRDKAIRPDPGSLARRVLDGETLVRGQSGGEDLALPPELDALGFRSAAVAPLRVEDRVIGTLGLYAEEDNRFGPSDAHFLGLTAELAAIGIDDARTNEAVERLMRERTEFTLQVAHNLRAPLSASLSMLELFDEDYLGPINESQREYLNRIGGRLRSLHRMIGELLTIGRTRDWSREIPDVVVDLELLAEQIQRTFQDEARGRRLEFRVRCEPDVPPIDSGADLLEQILENLVSNAIKYTPEHGEVEVRFESRGPDEVEIVVRDSGIGIPAAEQEKLFREFYRATNAKMYTREGTGLGLTLVKQAVERHGGRLELTSEEGRGTTVAITLPVHRPVRAAS